MMPGNHVNDLAAEYALGALDDGERASVDAHIRVCPLCADAIDDALTTAGMLSYLVPQLQPSVATKAALFQRVAHAQRAAAISPLPLATLDTYRTPTLPASHVESDLVLPAMAPAVSATPKSARQSRTGWIISAVSAPLLIALVVTGMWGLQLRDQVSLQSNRMADLQSELTNFGSGTTSYQLSPGDAAPQAEGQIVLGSDGRAGMLQVDVNSKQAAGEYQMLVNEDGKLVNVAEFTVNAEGKGQAQFDLDLPYSEYESIHIKAKPADMAATSDDAFDALFQDNSGSLGSTGSGLDVGP